MQSSRRGWTASMRVLAVALVAMTAAACTVHDQEAPSLAGPSGFGIALTMTATPQAIQRDGSSQTTVTVTARDESGKPFPNLPLFARVSPDDAQITQVNANTDASGQVRFVVTAPLNSVPAPNNQLVVVVTAGSRDSDFLNSREQSMSIGLIGTPNATEPTVRFTFIPEEPEIGQNVVFDASTTTDEGVLCDDTHCKFEWDFGGLGSRTGRVVSFAFGAPGAFAVTLTVTDSAGTVRTSTQSIVVVAPASLEADFVFSPTQPTAGATVFFDGSASKGGTGVTITSYSWNFGDGGTGTGATPSHPYAAAGTYTVTLVVTDSAGRTDSVSKTVTVN